MSSLLKLDLSKEFPVPSVYYLRIYIKIKMNNTHCTFLWRVFKHENEYQMVYSVVFVFGIHIIANVKGTTLASKFWG
jgi:hypothetical protein